jgi:hypothetical protein
MDKGKITKRIVQGVAITFGLIGLLLIYMGADFVITGIREFHLYGLLEVAPLILLVGIYLGVAWQNLRHFGPNSVKNVTLLVVFTLYTILAPFDVPSEERRNSKTELIQVAKFLIPLLLMFFLYSIISKKLIQMTKAKDIRQADSAESIDPVAQNDAVRNQRENG